MIPVGLGLVALIGALAPTSAQQVERLFSGAVYSRVQPWLTGASNLAPFALFDVLLGAAVVAIVLLVGRACWRPRVHAWRAVGALVTMGATVYLVFLMTWGLHYRRVPFRQALDFRTDRVTPEALEQLAGRTVSELNAIHPWLPARWPEWTDLRAALQGAFRQASAELGVPERMVLGEPKRTLLEPWFRRTGTDGMVNPFFLEVLVNGAVLPVERPFVVTHEWGHLAGRADESEASLLAWLACMHGPPWARYSAWLSLYGEIAAGLPRDRRTALGQRLETGPRRDLVAVAERIRADTSPTLRRAGQATYDRFLKANRLPEGITSYGLVVRLLLGTRLEPPPLILPADSPVAAGTRAPEGREH